MPHVPEVEIDVADRVLDGRPQRPPVLGHQPQQPCSRHLVGDRPAVVVGHQGLELVERQVRLAPDVAELESGVAVARVLVVDQPQAVAAVDEVGRQQVVVAGDGRHRARPEGGGDPLDLGLEVEVPVGQPEAAPSGRCPGSRAAPRTCRSRSRSGGRGAASGTPRRPAAGWRCSGGRRARRCAPRPRPPPGFRDRAGRRPPPGRPRSRPRTPSCGTRPRGRWTAGPRPATRVSPRSSRWPW